MDDCFYLSTSPAVYIESKLPVIGPQNHAEIFQSGVKPGSMKPLRLNTNNTDSLSLCYTAQQLHFCLSVMMRNPGNQIFQ